MTPEENRHMPESPDQDVREDHGGAPNLTIIVNGRERTVREKELTYEALVALAFDPVPSGPNVLITVTFRKGQSGQQGSVVQGGEPVKVHNRMIFNVTATDKS
jgi:hypothetical protein